MPTAEAIQHRTSGGDGICLDLAYPFLVSFFLPFLPFLSSVMSTILLDGAFTGGSFDGSLANLQERHVSAASHALALLALRCHNTDIVELA